MPDKIDVQRLAREAEEYAMRAGFSHAMYRLIRDEHFARLVMEECAKVCRDASGPIEVYNKAYPHYLRCAELITERMP